MKIQTVALEGIERIGVLQDKNFSINFDAKMARILADGLYSDKVQSVIRELSCNAYDSHVMAGCADKPIEVHFPNAIEPEFWVRDNGTGLNHREVMSIYTTYGASTKTTSNLVIGQLGLGSKSPFSVTDVFTVEARKDGVENHYSMYRNEQGMPSVAHLHSTPTTEPNGVTVRVPVSRDLRNEFLRKAQEVYKWFPVKPVAVGESIDYPAMDWEYRGTGWGIRKSNSRKRYYGEAERPVALMGMVAYPLDARSIKGLSNNATNLLSLPVVLEFDIGDLEVAANREALGYDERTCANIVAKINQVVAELGTMFEQQIADAKSLWHAKQKFGEIFQKSDYSYEFGNLFKNLGLRWKNEVIKNASMVVETDKLYPTNQVSNLVDIDAYEANPRYKRPRKIGSAAKLHIDCEARTVIMLNDLNLGGMSRVMEYHKGHEYNKVIFVFNPSSIASWEQIQKALGNPDVIYTSSLPKPARKSSGQRTGMLKYKGGWDGKKAWEPVELDLEDGGYYVELDGWDVVYNGLRGSDLNWYMRTAKELGIIAQDTAVYAMRYKNRQIVREHEAWTEFFSDIKTKLEEMIKARNLSLEVAKADEYRRLKDYADMMIWDKTDVVFGIKDPTSPMLTFANVVKDYTVHTSTVDNMRAMAQRFGIALDKAAVQHDLVALFKTVIERYPMLKIVSRAAAYSYRAVNADEWYLITDYINHIDATAVFVALQDPHTPDSK